MRQTLDWSSDRLAAASFSSVAHLAPLGLAAWPSASEPRRQPAQRKLKWRAPGSGDGRFASAYPNTDEEVAIFIVLQPLYSRPSVKSTTASWGGRHFPPTLLPPTPSPIYRKLDATVFTIVEATARPVSSPSSIMCKFHNCFDATKVSWREDCKNSACEHSDYYVPPPPPPPAKNEQGGSSK